MVSCLALLPWLYREKTYESYKEIVNTNHMLQCINFYLSVFSWDKTVRCLKQAMGSIMCTMAVSIKSIQGRGKDDLVACITMCCPIPRTELEETICLPFRDKVSKSTKTSPNLLLPLIVLNGRKWLHSWYFDSRVAVHALGAGFLFQP